MKRLFHGQSLIKLIFTLTLFLLSSSGSLTAATSPDAIAFRVLPNLEHLSPLRWYQEKIKLKGSPQALIVDGYEAVRDGRSVYVHAANIDSPNSPNSKFYSNIYIISFNQAAENATIDIFGQILAKWRFNTNIDSDPLTARCSKTTAKTCLYSTDCPAGEYCLSQKAKIIRDTKRLADLSDLKLILDNYQKAHSGDYPALTAGSYLAGKSISVWPSWRATLGKELATELPIDPVNKLGVCDPDPANPAANGLYDSNTCWDQKNKKFADPTPDNNEFNLPANSHAYVYTYNANGSYNVSASMESCYLTTLDQGACPGSTVGYTGPGAAPASQITINCGTLRGHENNEFSGYVSVGYSGRGALQWQIDQTGLNLGASGWTAMEIQAVPGVSKQKKLWSRTAGGGSYSVRVTVADNFGSSAFKDCPIIVGECGDSEVNGGGETCDNGAANTDRSCVPTASQANCSYCDASCHLHTVNPSCGDGVKNGSEECDKNDPDPAGRARTCVTSATLPCGNNMDVAGTETCSDTCAWNTCIGLPPTAIDFTSEGCLSTNKVLADTDINTGIIGYACCAIIKCRQDGCGCCGFQADASVTSGYTNTYATAARTSFPATWDSSKFITYNYNYGKCPGGWFDGTNYMPAPPNNIADLCTSCEDKARFYPEVWKPGTPATLLTGTPYQACKVNQSEDNERYWEVTTNHSTAYYRCWR